MLWDWPLFLFPCGFQARASHAVLDAGLLIKPHFLHSVCLITDTPHPTDLCFASPVAIGSFWCTSDRCRKMFQFFGFPVNFSRCQDVLEHDKILLLCQFWLWHLGPYLPVGELCITGRRKKPPPQWQWCWFSLFLYHPSVVTAVPEVAFLWELDDISFFPLGAYIILLKRLYSMLTVISLPALMASVGISSCLPIFRVMITFLI